MLIYLFRWAAAFCICTGFQHDSRYLRIYSIPIDFRYYLSKISRNSSPKKLNAIATLNIAKPGNVIIHQ